MFSHDVITACC